MKILIVGLGLIGGSIAKAIRQYTPHDVSAVDINGETLYAAYHEGLILNGFLPHELSAAALSKFELVFVCLNPGATIDFIEKNSKNFGAGATVVDICGVKRPVCERLFPQFRNRGAVFIGGHPMAGKETSSYKSAEADMLKNASFLLVFDEENPQSAREQALIDLLRAIGFLPLITDMDTHDRRIAYTSQLPHMVAAAYILDEQCRSHSGYSAGSFRDLSRVARLNADMWQELMILNRDSLSDSLSLLIDHLTELKLSLQSPEKLKSLLKRAADIKEETLT